MRPSLVSFDMEVSCPWVVRISSESSLENPVDGHMFVNSRQQHESNAYYLHHSLSFYSGVYRGRMVKTSCTRLQPPTEDIHYQWLIIVYSQALDCR